MGWSCCSGARTGPSRSQPCGGSSEFCSSDAIASGPLKSLKGRSEMTMAPNHLSNTHQWAKQEVSIKGRQFLHRRCQICERDFARALGEEEIWRAVHVGVLSFDFL